MVHLWDAVFIMIRGALLVFDLDGPGGAVFAYECPVHPGVACVFFMIGFQPTYCLLLIVCPVSVHRLL